jgi:hypothetical protein
MVHVTDERAGAHLRAGAAGPPGGPDPATVPQPDRPSPSTG